MAVLYTNVSISDQRRKYIPKIFTFRDNNPIDFIGLQYCPSNQVSQYNYCLLVAEVPLSSFLAFRLFVVVAVGSIGYVLPSGEESL